MLLTILEFIQQKLGSNVYATSGFPKWQASYPRIFCHHRKLTRVAWHLLIWLAVAPARMCDPFPRVQKLPVVEIRYVTWQVFKYCKISNFFQHSACNVLPNAYLNSMMQAHNPRVRSFPLLSYPLLFVAHHDPISSPLFLSSPGVSLVV